MTTTEPTTDNWQDAVRNAERIAARVRAETRAETLREAAAVLTRRAYAEDTPVELHEGLDAAADIVRDLIDDESVEPAPPRGLPALLRDAGHGSLADAIDRADTAGGVR